MRSFLLMLLLLGLSACNLSQPDPTPLATTPPPMADAGRLAVAWVTGGDLMVWQTGDTVPRRVASGGVVQPIIAPDGARVAFTRGPQGNAETLWVVGIDGMAEQQLIGERPATYRAGEQQIGDVVWLDARTVYLNTLAQDAAIYQPQNDLLRVDVITREIAQIAAAGEGGRISVSPNGDTLLTVYHGTYQERDGVIRRMDLLGRTSPTTLLTFEGVATGSEFRFYPTINWVDNDMIMVALPDPDLLYAPISDAPVRPTALWQIPVMAPENRREVGTVEANFFGLPLWSVDGQRMTFLRQDASLNQYTAYVADGDGSDPQSLFVTQLTDITPPEWHPFRQQLIYSRLLPDSDGGRRYLVTDGVNAPQPLSDDALYDVRYVDDMQTITITEGAGRLEMRFNTANGESVFIGSLNAVPIFDAVWVDGS